MIRLMATPHPSLPGLPRAVPLACAALLALGVTACGGPDPTPSGPLPSIAAPDKPSVASGVPQAGEPLIVGVTYVGGKATGDTGTVQAAVGTEIRVTVLSDVADVLHVTGYDQRVQVTINQPVQLELLADRAGEFTVELEGKGVTLTRLQVG